MGTIYKFYSIFCMTFFSVCAFATWAQVYYYDLQIYNQQQNMERLIADIVIGISVFLVALSIFSLIFSQAKFLGRLLFSCTVIYIITESLVRVLDAAVVSGSSAMIGGPLRLYKIQGNSFIGHKSKDEKNFGFKVINGDIYSDADIIFIGDSYMRGSAQNPENDFASVVAQGIQKLAPGMVFLNAGVGGLGPRDERQLYQLVISSGLTPSAVILSVFVQNDFTDNIEGMIRLPISGMIQRIPNNLFIRFGSPLNHYIFRYFVYFYRMSKEISFTVFDSPEEESPDQQDKGCDTLGGRRAGQVMTVSAHYNFVKERYVKMYTKRVPSSPLVEELHKIARISNENDIALKVVIFPDSTIAQYDRYPFVDLVSDKRIHAEYVAEIKRAVGLRDTLDLSETLIGRSDLYSCNDTHLNDAGNIVAGREILLWLQRGRDFGEIAVHK